MVWAVSCLGLKNASVFLTGVSVGVPELGAPMGSGPVGRRLGVRRPLCLDTGNSSQRCFLVSFEIEIPFLLAYLRHRASYFLPVLPWETFLHFYKNFTASHFKMSRCYCSLSFPLMFSFRSSALMLIFRACDMQKVNFRGFLYVLSEI